MARRLKMALVESIITLHQRGWCQRRIARQLGLNRETVARYLQQASTPAKPAIAPPGTPESLDDSDPAIAPPGSEPTSPRSQPAIAPPGSERRGPGRPS